MCLTILRKTYKPVKRVSGTGVKMFFKSNGRLFFECYSVDGKYSYDLKRASLRRVPRDRWLTASRGSITMGCGSGKLYPKGFHVYTDKRLLSVNRGPASGYVLVKWSGLVAEGWQSVGGETIVVRQIYVPREKKEKA